MSDYFYAPLSSPSDDRWLLQQEMPVSIFIFSGKKRNDSSMMMLCDGIVMLCDAKVISKLLVNKLYTMFYVDMCDDDGIFL